MASGDVNRTQRPNTWLHRPSLRREDFPCQLGAVHTWSEASFGATQWIGALREVYSIIGPSPCRLVKGHILACARRWDADEAPQLVQAKCACP